MLGFGSFLSYLGYGYLDSWHGAAELRGSVPFIVVGRAGAGGARQPIEMPDVSSTEIRRALHEGRSVAGLVSRAIVDYIHARGLFGASKPA